MKRKKLKITGSTLFVFRPKNAQSGIDTDPMTTTTTMTTTHVFQK